MGKGVGAAGRRGAQAAGRSTGGAAEGSTAVGWWRGSPGRAPPHVHAVERAAADGASQALQRLRGHCADLGRGLHPPGEAAREVGVALRRGEAPEAAEHAAEVEQWLVRVRRQPRAQLGLGGTEVEAGGLERVQLPRLQLQRRAGLVDVAEPLEQLGCVGALVAERLALVQLHEEQRPLRRPRRGAGEGAAQVGRLAYAGEGQLQPAPVEVVVDTHAVRLAVQVSAPELLGAATECERRCEAA